MRRKRKFHSTRTKWVKILIGIEFLTFYSNLTLILSEEINQTSGIFLVINFDYNHFAGSHIPQKIDYGLGDIFIDLLAFANSHLPTKCRIAYWIPVSREFYSEDMLPRHPCFELGFYFSDLDLFKPCNQNQRLP